MKEHTLQVGKPYNAERSAYPTTEQVRISRTFCELVRYWPSPTSGEVAEHDSGAASFALVDESPDLLVMAYKFGSLDWSDAPFQAWRMNADLRGWPRGGPGGPVQLTTVLVDASTGVVRSLRVDAWSRKFSNSVRVAVAEQLVNEFDDESAARRLGALYREFDTPERMVRERAIVQCRSDEPLFGGHPEFAINYV